MLVLSTASSPSASYVSGICSACELPSAEPRNVVHSGDPKKRLPQVETMLRTRGLVSSRCIPGVKPTPFMTF